MYVMLLSQSLCVPFRPEYEQCVVHLLKFVHVLSCEYLWGICIHALNYLFPGGYCKPSVAISATPVKEVMRWNTLHLLYISKPFYKPLQLLLYET